MRCLHPARPVRLEASTKPAATAVGPDEYSDWFANSEELADLASDFFEAFRYSPPPDLRSLKDLMEDVPPPSDEEPDSRTEDYARSNAEDYWSVTRIFEDL